METKDELRKQITELKSKLGHVSSNFIDACGKLDEYQHKFEQQEEKLNAFINLTIDALFESDRFKEKLTDYIVKNIRIEQKYNSYNGKYEQMRFYFGDNEINIDESSYGY